MNIIARRKSLGACKSKNDKEKEIKAGGPGKIGSVLDKGFPYDDGDSSILVRENNVKSKANNFKDYTAVAVVSQVEPSLAE